MSILSTVPRNEQANAVSNVHESTEGDSAAQLNSTSCWKHGRDRVRKRYRREERGMRGSSEAIGRGRSLSWG